MKILLVHYRFFMSGGPERYMFNLIEALKRCGHQVIPFSIRNASNLPSDFSDYFVDNIGGSDAVFVGDYPKTPRAYIDLIFREFYSIKVRKALERLIDDTRPDVCYLLAYKRALSPSVIDACKSRNVPVVNRISDYNMVCSAGSLYRGGSYCEECLNRRTACLAHGCVKGSRLYSTVRYLSGSLHAMLGMKDKIDAYVLTNDFMRGKMAAAGFENSKLHVIPTFFGENDETTMANKTNRAASTVKLLYIGNLDESKGIYDLISALAVAKGRGARLVLEVVGGLHASENNRAKKLVNDSGLADTVRFLPFVASGDVYRKYLESNVTVLPARWPENLPNTLIESVYFHRPVLVPSFGSFLSTTNDDVAFYYEWQSADSLADRLVELAANPSEVERKSENCERFYIENYSGEAHLKRLLTLFQEVMGAQK